jgi:alkyldihydroxyacetonephosphate synthase
MEQNQEAGIDPPSSWSPVPPSRIAAEAALRGTPAWLGGVEAIVGSEFVLSGLPDRWVYSRDRSPYAVFQVRNSGVPATLPAAIACPGSVGELAALLRFARECSIPVVPFGAGSGVLGGTLPVARELVIDLKRLNRVLDLDEIDGTVTVQAGMNGAQFEGYLNARGFTSGHFPQSLHMSTVGGWAACRSAGQNSTRYGKFEDMVLGLEVVLPDGELLRVRPMSRHGAGPGLASLFVGSEGAYGVISEVTLRVWRQPEARRGLALAFPSVEAGLAALRTTLQSELRPAVVRLYDHTESLQRTRGSPPFDSRPILAILEHCGLEPLAALESRLTYEICAGFDAVQAGRALYEEWQGNRFGSLSTPWQVRDHYVDTIEIVAGWSALPGLYAATRDAVLAISPEFHFGTHWSHVYPEGACQYMTLRLPPMPQQRALDLLRNAWERIQCLCLAAGGSIAHHHGIGLFRGPWLRQELGTPAFGLLQALKDCLDPQGLLVPGKLGLAGGAHSRQRDAT